MNVIEAIDKLAGLGVINSPGYWKEHYKDTTYVEDLLIKSASVINNKGNKTATVESGVNALVTAGIINSPTYWKLASGTVGELLKALGGAALTNTSASANGTALRNKVCDIINGWVGSVRGDATHLAILEIYNSHKPLARGHKMSVSEPHCATTVSAAFIAAGIADYTGTECSTNNFIQIAKQKGIWIENDAHIPQKGDAIVYDWQDGTNYAATDNTGMADHIGIVTNVDVNAKTITVTEGNMGSNGKVGKRAVNINGRYIRGYICPKYEQIGPVNTTPYSAPNNVAEKCNIELPVLKSGDKNGYVKTVQLILNGKGKATLEPDGDFGAKTRIAVIAYQKTKSLTADGVVGENTWNSLLS